MTSRVAILLLAVGVARCSGQPPLPIIDMHMHAQPADFNGPPPLAVCAPFPDIMSRDVREDATAAFMRMQKNPPCPNPIWSPATDEGVMTATLEVLERRNIIGVFSAGGGAEKAPMERVRQWRNAAPDRVIPALGLSVGPNCEPRIEGRCLSADDVARLHDEGRFVVLGEVANQYEGIGPSDEVFEPFLAVAEQRNIPVGIHIGIGPSGAPYMGAPRYRARLHSALGLEEALVRHPKLRVYVMHAGWPMLDDLLAVLWTHPHVYVDVGALWALPRAEVHRYLQRIVESGFATRVMFGSDQMTWPGVIEPALDMIESAPFLSATQKRDILYNNAARFLQLSDAEIARHHGR